MVLQRFREKGAEMTHNIYKSKELAEQIAMNLRCSGVQAHVVECITYEVIVPKKIEEIL
jgi:hypothetical protein